MGIKIESKRSMKTSHKLHSIPIAIYYVFVYNVQIKFVYNAEVVFAIKKRGKNHE